MAIEWGYLNETTGMTHSVIDTSGLEPKTVLVAGFGFKVEVKWSLPAGLPPFIDSHQKFRLRAYAESIGPGQELQIGELVVAGEPNLASYAATMEIAPNPLKGEDQLHDGAPVSGMYNIVVVMQHIDATGALTFNSGCSDSETTVCFISP